MSYTKGKWRVAVDKRYGNVWIQDSRGREIALMYAEGGDQEANARLIAASPRMAEALRDIVTWYIGRGFDRELPEFRTCQKALALADGKGE